jgi:hypothetical protein
MVLMPTLDIWHDNISGNRHGLFIFRWRRGLLF